MATEGGESTDSLRREVEAMVCPICMELMNKPVTLAPCGHALCSHCATAHIKQHCQNKCPVCRSRIASTARNLQLASILHSYACEQEPSSDPSLDPLRMRSKLMGVEAREKHLSSELPRVRSEELDATSKLRSAEVALSCLRNDEADAVSKVEQAQKMLALVREQVREEEQKAFELEHTKEQASSRRSLLEQSLKELTNERRKLKALLSATDGG